MEIILQRVLYLIKKYNVSIYAVEKATHLSDGALKRWGKSPPSSERLLRVARYFGVSVDFLLGNTDNPRSHLNNGSIEAMLREINLVVEDWKKRITQNQHELDERIMQVKEKYGVESTSGIIIECEEIMSDKNLP